WRHSLSDARQTMPGTRDSPPATRDPRPATRDPRPTTHDPRPTTRDPRPATPRPPFPPLSLNMPPPRTYEIHEVAELTGLQPARLRVWERRYSVVRPVRQGNGYRAYSGEQVALLRAYARLVAAGERIGDLVGEPVEAVMARSEGRDPASSPHAELLGAIRAFDRERLESLVAQQL